MVDPTKNLLILRAAGELLDEAGFDALNTTEIAKRAGVSTATLYRHFPDKDAILRAVVYHLQSKRNKVAALYLDRLGTEPDWRAVIQELVQEMYHLRISEPGGRSSRRMLGYSAELLEFGKETMIMTGKAGGHQLSQRTPGPSRATAERISITAVAALTAILDVACDDARNGKRFVAEATQMCIQYLAPHLD